MELSSLQSNQLGRRCVNASRRRLGFGMHRIVDDMDANRLLSRSMKGISVRVYYMSRQLLLCVTGKNKLKLDE